MRGLIALPFLLAAMPAVAQDHSAHTPKHQHDAAPQAPVDHTGMDHAQHEQQAADGNGAGDDADHSAHAGGPRSHQAASETPPPRAFSGPRHAADLIYGEAAMAPSREELAQSNGAFRGGTIMAERLELRLADGQETYLWDVQGWYGGDLNKLWLKSEGEGEFAEGLEQAEVQALYSHAIGPWFDVQAGVRYDIEPSSTAHAVVGVQGLAPYMFELDAAAFLSEHGDLTARVEAEYDQRITQRLILQPAGELELAAQDIAARDVGAGLVSLEAGLRLRYEIAREFAPYIGVGYEAALGETADRMRGRGDDPDGWHFLAGVRAWF